MKITFLCGCTTGNIESLENLRTMDAIAVDEDGMLICAIHKMRRYGWRSVGLHHELDRLTPFELENFTIFAVVPNRPPVEIGDLHGIRDTRDNRDPEHVYFKSLQGRPPEDAELRASKVMDRPLDEIHAASSAARERLDLWDRTATA